jgi:sugar lactone lactonase YvrE
MRYRRDGEIGRGPGGQSVCQKTARAAALAATGTWYLGGDSKVHAFAGDGSSIGGWPTSQPAWSLAVDPTGRIWTGEAGQIEIFTADGKLDSVWRNEAQFGLVTAIGFHGEESFVADAGSRWIHRFASDRSLINHIGDRHRKGGFHIPNGIVDFAVDLDGTLVVANPGMHRVERYKPNGESLGHFGQFGQQDPAGFPGCCNPTNLALGPDGEIIVSEKAGPRVKVYDPQGQLLSVVASGDDFAPECKNMDLVVAADGRIGVVDPVERVVVLFEPDVSGATAEVTS